MKTKRLHRHWLMLLAPLLVVVSLLIVQDALWPRPSVSSAIVQGEYLGQQPPGREPVRFASGIVSTDRYEHGTPTFSRDGTEAYWTQLLGAHGSEAVIMYVKREAGTWTAPPRAEVFGGFDDMYPRFNGSGSRLFFSSGVSRGATGVAVERGIWFVSRRPDRRWSPPVHVGFHGLDVYGLS